MQRSSRPTRSAVIWIVVGLIALGSASQVAADEPIVIGAYTLAAHWREEPARVQQPNAVILVFTGEVPTDNNPDLTGLTFAVLQGDARTPLVVSTDEPGSLSAPFTPSRVGSAILEIAGTINGAEVAETLALADVAPVTVALPAIGVDTPASFGNAEAPGPDWVMIGGIAIAVAMLAAAILLGRAKS